MTLCICLFVLLRIYLPGRETHWLPNRFGMYVLVCLLKITLHKYLAVYLLYVYMYSKKMDMYMYGMYVCMCVCMHV